MRIEAERSSGDRHRRTRQLLPWYLNGTLDGEELEGVASHLDECESCRAELTFEKELARAVRSNEEIRFPVERGLRSLERRLDAGRAGQRDRMEKGEPIRGRRPLISQRGIRHRFVLAASFVAVVAVAVLVGYGSGLSRQSEYRVLSTPSGVVAPGPWVRVVFDDEVPVGRVRSLLTEIDGVIIDGPSEYGVFSIRVPETSREEALAHLRRSSWVRFAEPAPEVE